MNNKIIILAGFMRAGTHSMRQKLESEGYEVINLDESLYNKRSVNLPKLLFNTYGDIKVIFMKRRNKKNWIKALKRVQHRRKMRRLTTKDCENMISEKHIDKFKKHFSKVGIYYLEDMNFPDNYYRDKSSKLHKIIYFIPTEVLSWCKALKEVCNPMIIDDDTGRRVS